MYSCMSFREQTPIDASGLLFKLRDFWKDISLLTALPLFGKCVPEFAKGTHVSRTADTGSSNGRVRISRKV